VDASFAQANVNEVDYLGFSGSENPGNYAVNGSFTLRDDAVKTQTLTVAGMVTVGAGKTLMLVAPTLSIDDSGTTYEPTDSPPNPQTLTIIANGSLSATSTVATPGTVTPGEILLQTDNFSILPSASATPAISAPDGFVAIAPYTTGAITVLGSTTGPGVLEIGAGSAPLSAISTLGELLPDTPATDTLALGSLNAGKTTTASSIVFDLNGGTIDLTGVADTVQLNATGAVTQTGTAGTLLMPGIAGQAGSFTLVPNNTIAVVDSVTTIGNSPSREADGTIYQTSTNVTNLLGDLTDLTATAGDVRLYNQPAGTMTVVHRRC